MPNKLVVELKMAKWGEGDPRWIVEERADATNVNNWHWFVSFCFTHRCYKNLIQASVASRRIQSLTGACSCSGFSGVEIVNKAARKLCVDGS